MPETVTQASCELAERGFVRLGPLLEPAEIERLQDETAPFVGGGGPAGYGVIVHNLWRRVPYCAELVATGRFGARARELCGAAEVVLFQDHLVAKTAGAAREVAWHQDYAYWPLSAPAGITLWIALDDAREENGCLLYVPGTHKLGERRPAEFVAGATQPAREELPPLEAKARAAEAVAVPAAAGSAIAHHPLVWHMSGPNRTARPRRAWSLTFVDASVRWDPGHAPHPYRYALSPAPGAPLEGFPRFCERDQSARNAR